MYKAELLGKPTPFNADIFRDLMEDNSVVALCKNNNKYCVRMYAANEDAKTFDNKVEQLKVDWVL